MTSTDIRDKIVVAGRNPAETSVWTILTAPVFTVNPSWSLQECARRMQAHSIHHMPVLGEQGELVGLISAFEIKRAAEAIGWGSGS